MQEEGRRGATLLAVQPPHRCCRAGPAPLPPPPPPQISCKPLQGKAGGGVGVWKGGALTPGLVTEGGGGRARAAGPAGGRAAGGRQHNGVGAPQGEGLPPTPAGFRDGRLNRPSLPARVARRLLVRAGRFTLKTRERARACSQRPGRCDPRARCEWRDQPWKGLASPLPFLSVGFLRF